MKKDIWPKGLIFSLIEPKFISFTSFCLVSTKASSGVLENVSLIIIWRCYEVAKVLARILKPLVGSSPHHVKNTGDFIDHIKHVTLQANEIITSYDVSALFTSVPIEAAINIIQRRLELDQELHSRTTMKVEHITSLLEFCLKTTYFQFQGSFYEQINGAAMGSPHQPHCGQPLHGGLWSESHQHCQEPSQNVEELCGWQLCHLEFYNQRRVLPPHK